MLRGDIDFNTACWLFVCATLLCAAVFGFEHIWKVFQQIREEEAAAERASEQRIVGDWPVLPEVKAGTETYRRGEVRQAGHRPSGTQTHNQVPVSHSGTTVR